MTKKMKLVQCWDDGVEDDIRLIEILRRHGAKASFNLNPGLHGEQRGGTWRYQEVKDVRRLARGELLDVYDGFTIANHTVSHPWPLKISIEEWRREVVDGRRMLQDWFQQPVHGFVYPFGQRSDETDVVVREAGHLYARGTGRVSESEAPGFPPADPLRFVPDGHFRDAALRDKWLAAQASGREVFYFWGHSYEMVSEEDWEAFERLIAEFSGDSECVWADLPDLFSDRLL